MLAPHAAQLIAACAFMMQHTPHFHLFSIPADAAFEMIELEDKQKEADEADAGGDSGDVVVVVVVVVAAAVIGAV